METEGVYSSLDTLPVELLLLIVENVLNDRPATPAPRRYVHMLEHAVKRRHWHIPVHSIAQTSRALRRAALPLLWKTLAWDGLGDVKHFDRFMGSVAKARSTYGIHVRNLTFRWTWIERQASYSDQLLHKAFQLHVELEDPFNHDNYDYHPVFEAPEDFYDAFGRLVAQMPQLRRFDWRVTRLPLSAGLALRIRESCPTLDTNSSLIVQLEGSREAGTESPM